jgi:peptidoglycan/xylan/chitin deacetylase (PgdA/CDA1 family)
MNWTQPNIFIRLIYQGALWRINTKEKKLYLTFDDGPIPTVTDWVLDFLREQNIKASFFCIGKNVKNNPEIFKRIIKEGHAIGNHSFNHENGWLTSYTKYLNSISQCADLVETKLFRPPYGKLSFRQFFTLRKQYKIVLWDVLTYDYDQSISPETSLTNSILKTRSGSIIIFHDSLKAFKKMKEMLPIYVQDCLKKGYQFDTLEFS